MPKKEEIARNKQAWEESAQDQAVIPPIYGATLKYKLIYIFTIHDKTHEGYWKIGEHTFDSSSSYRQLPPNCTELNNAARERIDEYTKTALIDYDLRYTELARRRICLEDGTEEWATFSDEHVHNVLYNSGYSARKFSSGKDSEWFEVDLQTAINAIQAVKEDRDVLSVNEKGGSATSLPAPSVFPPPVLPLSPPIVLRTEQKDCIDRTRRVFKKYDSMLWNCKMRFGKTITAYELIKACDYGKVLIVTHRPSVLHGWREDFYKVFGKESGRTFLCKDNAESGTDYDPRIDAGTDRKLRDRAASGQPFVYFASMQDLRGSALVGGPFQKNHAVFALDWDLIVYDEAHEGTQSEKGKPVQNRLNQGYDGKKPKVLHLSGTPYNLLDGFEENQYLWDYVMEQKRKQEWAREHPGDHNPYADLPELKIRTFDLSRELKNFFRYDEIDAAFNFTEFFRVWTGNPKLDFYPLPSGVHVGEFVHEDDVRRFLDILTEERAESLYPFATVERREMFLHTFWIVPGVKAALALGRLLREHPVFSAYEIVNIAGDGDAEIPFDDAVKLVKEKIRRNPRTITISCGRLTVGATVPEWTAVMMLSGSSTASASGYMQTIFRVQSAGTINGKQKDCGYVFDFAPDRILQVLPEVYRLQKRGKQTDADAQAALGEFLNFCPVLAIDGTNMVNYDVPRMMRQIKRITVDRAIRSGFDDESVYKADTGIVMDSDDVSLINQLGNILTPQKRAAQNGKVIINQQGLDQEEYKWAEKLKRKPKRELTEEDKELLEKRRKQEETKKKVIALLRNISIRLPLLIYGAKADLTENIGMADFLRLVDDESWKEFMPKDVTKALFRRLWKYYDEDVVIGAGLKIRRMARAADELPPARRIQRIAEIFDDFRNPDKETVLTPWRVVNMHLSDTIGGYCFLNEQFDAKEPLDDPRLVERDGVTAELLLNPSVKVLEMNSKSGLYPLYMAYSVYAMRLTGREEELPLEETQALWRETLEEHIFVLCKTKMAESITRRTLAGYQDWTVNTVCLTKLLERMKDQKRLARKLTNPKTWGKEGERLKFDAIVGNPPYHEDDSGYRVSASPVYQFFVEQAKQLTPRYASMIIPARWFSGGKGLDEFRDKMLHDTRLKAIHDYPEAVDCFSNVQIKGGICYLLWDSQYTGDCTVTTHRGSQIGKSVSRPLLEPDCDVFIRYNEAIDILRKVQALAEKSFQSYVSTRKPFGLDTLYRGSATKQNNSILLYENGGISYIDSSEIQRNAEWVNQPKVFIPEAGSGSDSFPHPILGRPFLGKSGTASTETYLLIGPFETDTICNHVISYIRTKFFRFLVLLKKPSQHATSKVYSFVPVQDFSKPWTDAELYQKYRLSDDEIAFIESMIKPME